MSVETLPSQLRRVVPSPLVHVARACASSTPAPWRPGKLSLVALVLGTPAGALACPDCVVGRAARLRVWNEDFAANLGTLLAPFVLMVLVCLWAERREKSRS